jgi:sn-glycerol 3-phosphate transport system permease protein
LKRATFRGAGTVALLVAPQLLLLLWFTYWPALRALSDSLHLPDPFTGAGTFVGLENFSQLLADPDYWRNLRTTVVFSAAVAIVSLGVGLILALLVDRLRRGAGLWRTALIWPYAAAPAVAGVLWLFLFDPHHGLLAYAMNTGLALGWAPHLNGTHAMILIVIAAAWKQISYNFVFLVAGLAAIPSTFIEAAALDGARPLRRVLTIILPLLTPTLFLLLVLNVIYAFFETLPVIDITTQGRPAGETMTLVYRVYRDGFVGLDLGSASAQSVLLMLFVIALTWVQFRVLEKRVHYAS